MEQIYFVLTETCNLACEHCIRESSPSIKNAMAYDPLIPIIDDVKKHYPGATILLTGGEPTIYKNFTNILKYALETIMDVLVNTNAASNFFTNKKLEAFRNYENLRFQISLDGVEAIHNEIRGKHTYKKSLESIKLLTSIGFKCSVSATVLDTSFIDKADDFINELKDLNLSHIAIKRATFAGRAAEGYPLTNDKWNEFVYRIKNSEIKTNLIISPMYDFKKLDEINTDELASFEEINHKHRNCGAGTTKVYIYPNFDVCSCTCFKNIPMGNLFNNNLNTIIKNYNSIPVTSSTCSNCRYSNLCNGGCLGSGYQYFGILGSPDPRCSKITID